MLFVTIKSIIKIIFYFPIRNRFRYKNEKNDRIFILGTAISLKKDIAQKINELKEEKVFVMNQFVFSDLFIKIKPQYYVLADPIYWSNNFSEKEQEIIYNVINGLIENVSWNIYLFIPFTAFKSKRMEELNTNSFIKIIKYSPFSLNGFRFFRNWIYKHNIGMPPPQTVLNAAVFLALNSGYKNINILGADHTWIKQLSVGYDNLIYYEDNHFYDKEKAQKVAFVDGDNKDWTIEMWLMSMIKMFRSHYILKDYAHNLGAGIYNLTSDTLLDVYERKMLEDII